MYGSDTDKLLISFTTAASSKQASEVLGSGNVRVYPIDSGMTVYGQAKLNSSSNSVRVVVTEFAQ